MKQLLALVVLMLSGCCGSNDSGLSVLKLHETLATIEHPPLAEDGTPYAVFENLSEVDQNLEDVELGHQFPQLMVDGHRLTWNETGECYQLTGSDVRAMWTCEYSDGALIRTHVAIVMRREGDKWQQYDPIAGQWVETSFAPPPLPPLSPREVEEAAPEGDLPEKPKLKVKSAAFTKQTVVTRIFIADFSPRAGRPYYNANTGPLTVVHPVYLEGETDFVDQDLLRLAREKANVELEFSFQLNQRNDLKIVRRVTKK